MPDDDHLTTRLDEDRSEEEYRTPIPAGKMPYHPFGRANIKINKAYKESHDAV